MTTSQKPLGLGALLIIGLIFFATGFSGLVYQVAWQRYLLNIFGATLYSVTTVLAAFMGGLALGSIIAGKLSERLRSHLAVYGVIEILIGVAALCVPFALHVFDPLFQALHHALSGQFFLFSLVRFALVFLILLIPTTLMGSTLPILSKYLAPTNAGAGTRVGALYSLNTLGAVAGTVLAGFFLIRIFGVQKTVYIAAAINIIAGIISLGLQPLLGRTPLPDQNAPALLESKKTTPRLRLIHLTFFVSGFCSLGLEIAWVRGLVFTFDFLKNTTYSFSAMLSVFLIGIALGSFVSTPFADKHRQPLRLYSAVLTLTGLSSILSFFVLYLRAGTIGDGVFLEVDPNTGVTNWLASLALVYMRTGAVMFLPTFCMGFAFPIAVRAALQETQATGREVGRLYAFNTFGAILGSFLTGFFILPSFGIAGTIITFGIIQTLAGLLLFNSMKELPSVQRLTWTALGVACILVSFVRMTKEQPIRFQPDTPIEKVIFYDEGPLATVSVTENSLKFRTIYVDNNAVAGTDPILLTDQKSLAHVPMLLMPQAKSALTVGFGSGGASYSYTLYPGLEKIHCAEISKNVTKAAPTLTGSNHDVIMYAPEYQARTGLAPNGPPLWNDGGASGWFKRDARYDIVVDDVRSYLRYTGMKYDIIATDCTDLKYKSNANLYDLEYFKLCREHITDDGMVVVWMPLAHLRDATFRVALRTFYRVFPNMEVFFMNNTPTHYVLLIGTKEPLKVDIAGMENLLKDPEINRDLAEIFLNSPLKVLSCFVTGRDAMKDYLAGDKLNTEDFPYLEFETPRDPAGDEPLLANVDRLFEIREHPKRLVANPQSVPEFMAALDKYYEASPAIIAGHKAYRQMKPVEALTEYQKAMTINPADTAVKAALDFDEIRRAMRGQPQETFYAKTFGELMLKQGRREEAVAAFTEAITNFQNIREPRPDQVKFAKESADYLARLYTESGLADRAKPFQEMSQRLGQAAPATAPSP